MNVTVMSTLAESDLTRAVAAGLDAARSGVQKKNLPTSEHPFCADIFTRGGLNDLLELLALAKCENVDALVQIIDAQRELRERLNGALRRWREKSPQARALGPELNTRLKAKLSETVRNEFRRDFPSFDIRVEYWTSDSLSAMILVSFQGLTIASSALSWTSGDIAIGI